MLILERSRSPTVISRCLLQVENVHTWCPKGQSVCAFLPNTFQRPEKRRGIAKCIEGVRPTALLSFLDQERSVAHAGDSRWLVPPAALETHLSIGQVYAFSVFKIP